MNFVKKMLISLATVTMMVCLFGMSASAMGTDVQMTFANVNMRTGPGTSYGVIMVIPSGAQVYIEQTQGGWSYVDYNSASGWVSSQYLGNYGSQPTYSAPTTYGSIGAGSGTRTVSSAVNLRTGPGTGYGIITVVPAGAGVTLYGSNNGWSNVNYNGFEGYIATNYINGMGGGSSSSSNTNIANAGDQVLTSSDFTNMYSNGTTDSDVINQLCSGTRLYVLGRSSGWYQVSNCGVNGWIPAYALCKYLGGPCLTT